MVNLSIINRRTVLEFLRNFRLEFATVRLLSLSPQCFPCDSLARYNALMVVADRFVVAILPATYLHVDVQRE